MQKKNIVIYIIIFILLIWNFVLQEQLNKNNELLQKIKLRNSINTDYIRKLENNIYYLENDVDYLINYSDDLESDIRDIEH